MNKLKIHSFKNPCEYRWKFLLLKISEGRKKAVQEYYQTVWGTTKVNCVKCLSKKKRAAPSVEPETPSLDE